MGGFARIYPTRARVLAGAGLMLFALTGLTPTPPAPTPPVSAVRPNARFVEMPGAAPDGRAYTPQAVLDDGRSVGTLTAPDGRTTQFVLVTGDTFRPLRPARPAGAASIDAFATVGGRLYWMERDGDHEELWAADPARRVTADTGDVLFTGSVHDLQAVGGALTWVSAVTDGTEVRRVPANGGPVSARRIPGGWTPLEPPWLVSVPGVAGTPVEIYDPATGRRQRVPVGPDDTATCDRSWCVVLAGTADGAGELRLMRPDGTGRRVLADGGADPVSADVVLRDRFVVLAEPVPDGAERLWLYDIAAGRSVLLAGAATAAYARGDFVWWTTGAGWTALDLRSLA